MAEVELDDGKIVKVKKQTVKGIQQDPTYLRKSAEMSPHRTCNQSSEVVQPNDELSVSTAIGGNSDISSECPGGTPTASPRPSIL